MVLTLKTTPLIQKSRRQQHGAQDRGAAMRMLHWRVTGKPRCLGRVAKVKWSCHSVCQTLTFGLRNSHPLIAHCHHTLGRQNSCLVATNVKLSDEARETNSSWFPLEQDPHRHRSLNFSAHIWWQYSRLCCKIFPSRRDPFCSTLAFSPRANTQDNLRTPGFAFLFSWFNDPRMFDTGASHIWCCFMFFQEKTPPAPISQKHNENTWSCTYLKSTVCAVWHRYASPQSGGQTLPSAPTIPTLQVGVRFLECIQI